jgi:LAO/AO transport system kinase
LPTVISSEASIENWAERVRSGDPRALARAISAVENGAPESPRLLKALFPYSGKARVFGITGSPGAGKSTLVDQLAREYRRQGKTVGIVAVDPTSPYSGGAILGDRIRMLSHHADPGIFIRSMATRGFLGGLARATTDVATLLDASGKEIILIETVGVGQDEVDVVRLADVTVLILVPGMGDDVQTIKAGIMEIADVFVINKSDRDGADRVEREIRAMQSLAARKDRWTPPIVKTIATEGKGLDELSAAVVNYEQFLQKQDLLRKKKISNWQERLVEMLRDALLDRLLGQRLGKAELERLAAEVAEHRRDPYSLVEEIVDGFQKS